MSTIRRKLPSSHLNLIYLFGKPNKLSPWQKKLFFKGWWLGWRCVPDKTVIMHKFTSFVPNMGSNCISGTHIWIRKIMSKKRKVNKRCMNHRTCSSVNTRMSSRWLNVTVLHHLVLCVHYAFLNKRESVLQKSVCDRAYM